MLAKILSAPLLAVRSFCIGKTIGLHDSLSKAPFAGLW